MTYVTLFTVLGKPVSFAVKTFNFILDKDRKYICLYELLSEEKLIMPVKYAAGQHLHKIRVPSQRKRK